MRVAPSVTTATPSPPTIGIWGPTKAGKTTYLGGLYLAINRLAREWTMWPAKNDIGAQQFIEINAANLNKGIFPTPTDKGDHKSYAFRLFRKDSFLGINGRYHEIRLMDAAGGLISDNSDVGENFFKTLSQCQGILLMIDPSVSYELGQASPIDTEESYFELLLRLINHLSATRLNPVGKLDINVAFCLTKIDQDDHWEHKEKPKEYLQQVLGAYTFNAITNAFDPDKMNFFAISVVGRYQNRPNIVPVGKASRIADLSQWQPYNMLDPLFWLFDRIETERDSRLMWWRRWLRRLVRIPNYKKEMASQLLMAPHVKPKLKQR